MITNPKTLRAGLTLAFSVLLVATAALPAAADQIHQPPAGSTGNGYTVSVRFSGDAAPHGGARRVGVPAACWWAPAAGPYTDAAAMLSWYDATILQQHAVPGYYSTIYGPREIWQAAADAEKGGKDLSWYRATCRDPADYASYNANPGAIGAFALTLYRAFGAAQPLPAPLVRPADLVQAARDAMVIPVPATERNPKLQAAGNPTLVGLPTWFWVVNAAAVGGPAGTRTIRASVGNVWAEVVARTSGLQLSSAAGSTLCPPSRATTRYADGVLESSACTIEFSRASVAYPKGYPVTATTGWQATWRGSDGNTGPVDPLGRTATVNVPVAEVQNVVTSGG